MTRIGETVSDAAVQQLRTAPAQSMGWGPWSGVSRLGSGVSRRKS